MIGGVDTANNVPFNVLITTDVSDTGDWKEDGVNTDLKAERECTA